MNKYDLKAFLQTTLGPYASSFKETSFDQENQEYLCRDEVTHDVYNFDDFVTTQYDQSHLPASPDAIHIGKKDLYFVEFKNQYARDIDSAQIRKKFSNGTDILKSLLRDFNPRDCRYHFCVVFRNAKKPRYFDSRHIEQNSVRFGLEAVNKEHGSFYDQILTEELDFFVREFKQLTC